jgi:hypothetical protein
VLEVSVVPLPWLNNEVAANGQPVRENFSNWFKASKVVDANGAPLRVYHGTNQPIDSFNASRLGINTRSASSVAFFFTENPIEAGEYADMASRIQVADAIETERKVKKLQRQIEFYEKRQDWSAAERLYLEMEALDLGAINADPSGQNIIAAYLSIQRPMSLDLAGRFDGHGVLAAIKEARARGFDGLTLRNVYDPVGDRRDGFLTTQHVAFRAEQIKSAVGNSGLFLTDSACLSDQRAAFEMAASAQQSFAAARPW